MLKGNKTIIAQILQSKVYGECFPKKTSDPKNALSVFFGENNSQPNTIFDERDTIIEQVYMFSRMIKQPFKNLLNTLNAQVSNLYFSQQNYGLKQYILYNDLAQKHDPFTGFAKQIMKDGHENVVAIQFVNKWLKAFDIGDKLIITPIKANKTNIGISYAILNSGQDIQLKDNGLGIQKIVALLLRIVAANNSSTLVLEEPESNLHPAFQSKLAELLAEAYSVFDIRFIVETHSEYFIRKFQYLIANKDFACESNDLSIYYLYHPDKIPAGKKQVERLEIRTDGMLKQDFGIGFFDENARLTIDLLKLQNHN